LEKLKIEYFDLYLIHHGLGGKDVRLEQWRALLELKSLGLIKNAGVSNFSIKHLEEIKNEGLELPSANQIEIHPLCTQVELIEYCNNNNIVTIAYSSLAPASTWRTDPTHASAKQADIHATTESIAGKLIKNLCIKYNVQESQILLKWALQHKYPILPKSSQKSRIIDNCNLFHFTIDDNDMSELDALDENAALAWPAMIGNPLNAD
jgi:2,5-diketo-D-gluconate reductase A